jgi:hypothetical protein
VNTSALLGCGGGGGLTLGLKDDLVQGNKVQGLSSDVREVKENVPRLVLRKMCNRITSLTQSDAVGTFEILNRCIRQHILPRNAALFESGDPFVVDFELGYGQSMQIIIATAQSLDDYAAFGVDHLLSDTRHFGPSDESLKHTAAIVRDTNGRYRPAAASFSSTESSATASRFLQSMRRLRKCGPNCKCPLMLIDSSHVTRVMFQRRCYSIESSDSSNPLVSIDKDAAAALGFFKKVSVDIFHHMKAFSAKLKEFGLTNGSLLAAINQLHRVTLR